ncbi:MAG: Spy/CpxP family protein refolding chaperone [Proteobacteria bacterium]|nr:Spy/CpxP family protein refolding chaperone [Pseudomonadota bacterium]
MKLNRTLGLLLIATATVGAGAAVAAVSTTNTSVSATTAGNAGAPAGKHWHHGHRGGGMLVGVMLRATRQLNLTADQQASIKSIMSNARAQHQAAAGTAGVDMMTLANPGDPNYATALQNAKAAAAARLQNQVELQSQIYNVLTPDQKAKLPQVLADMKSKFEARRAAWQQQHGAATAGGTGSN